MSTKDMASSERIRNRLRNHIQEQIVHFGAPLPERHALVWAGYLAALLDEGLLDFTHYKELKRLLPKIADPNPVEDIFIFEPDNPLIKL